MCFIYNNVLYSVRNQQISLVEVTADEFYQQLRKQLWSVPHRYGPRYKGSTSPLWQHNERYSAEVGSYVSNSRWEGKSHFLTLNRELAR
jgi:hypothetical protein